MEHQQSRDELEQHLREQLGFLKVSAAMFDGGLEAEAKRLAVSLRLLLHDTSNSRSLLMQLGIKTDFWDSAVPQDPTSIASHGGLVVHVLSASQGVRQMAFLDNTPADAPSMVPFDVWWTSPVMVDQYGRGICRKDLVTWVANKDGGAHVDPKLNATYADLSRNNSLGWSAGASDASVTGAELAAVRQIAHEVLKTLEPGYACAPAYPSDGVPMAGLSVHIKTKRAASKTPATTAKVGRNDPCVCGSGKKWKKCCGG